jgi:hypothetical protein
VLPMSAVVLGMLAARFVPEMVGAAATSPVITTAVSAVTGAVAWAFDGVWWLAAATGSVLVRTGAVAGKWAGPEGQHGQQSRVVSVGPCAAWGAVMGVAPPRRGLRGRLDFGDRTPSQVKP